MEILKEKFINEDNILILWELLLETLNLKNNNPFIINKIKDVFDNNINIFINSQKFISFNDKNYNILDINKYFLNTIINTINVIYPNIQLYKNINISEENVKQLRIDELIKLSNEKKKELNDMINIKKPENIKFDLEINENKISDNEYEEYVKNRNYEEPEVEIIKKVNWDLENNEIIEDKYEDIDNLKYKSLNVKLDEINMKLDKLLSFLINKNI